MSRKTKVFECDDMLAVLIPKSYAEKIKLESGNIVSVSINSLNGVRIDKVHAV